MQVTKQAGCLHARWPKESELNKFWQPKRPSAARRSKLIRGIRKHTGGKNHTHEMSPESRNRQRPQKEETREHLQGPSVKHQARYKCGRVARKATEEKGQIIAQHAPVALIPGRQEPLGSKNPQKVRPMKCQFTGHTVYSFPWSSAVGS